MRLNLAAALVVLPALIAAAPQPVARFRKIGYPIPITKCTSIFNADKSVNLDALKSQVAAVQAKFRRGFAQFEKNTGSPHPAAFEGVHKRATGAEALTDDNGEVWYGTMTAGTPAVTDLLLPGSDCTSGCSGHTLYHPNASTTSRDLQQPFDLSYPDGSTITGELFSDTVSVAGLMVMNQTLGSISEYTPGSPATYFPTDGLMGLASQSISAFNATPVFQNLVNQGQTDKLVFSFKLAESGSELYLGGANSALYTGEFTYTPITQEGYWEVDIDCVDGNGQTILTNIDSIIDTSTPVIIGTPSDVATLYDALGGTDASSTASQGFYTFPCDSFPDVSFTFGGKSFPISADSLNLGPVTPGSSDCLSGIIAHDTALWTIGDVFLRNVYTTFDLGNARVGFAQLA